MDLSKFEVVNPYVPHPQLKVMEKIITLNEDVNKWLDGNALTIRINYDDKQIAIVKETSKDKELPLEAIIPKTKKNSTQSRINSLNLARTIRNLFEVSKGVLTLKGTVRGDYIIFERPDED